MTSDSNGSKKGMIGKTVSGASSLAKSAATSARESYRAAPPEMQKGAKRAVAIGLVLVIAFVAWSQGSAYLEKRNLETEQRLGPHVDVAVAKTSPTERNVSVLGEARPYSAVTLYARVSGYLKTLKVDKGDVVKKGQILAIIDSPETDRAYQAVSAEAKNKKAIADRMQKLFERQLVSQQEFDQAQSEADVAGAQFEAQSTLKSYETLRAPFDGTITARFSDPGALVQNATGSQASALPILSISQVAELRIYVYLDQRDAQSVEVGLPAEVSLNEAPDKIFKGRVARISGQLDEKTRMMLTEIDLENKKSEIMAGSLVQVNLHLKSAAGVEFPAEGLVLREGKTVAPVLNAENEITYTEVRLLENDGKMVKVGSGVKAGDRVALSLGNTLADRSKVRPNEPKVADKPAEKPATPAAAASATPPTIAPTPATTAPATAAQGEKK